MTRNEARNLHIATALVGVSGLVYAWMRYFVEPDPESFSVVNHPWQPSLRDTHLITAPLLVFACGLVWRAHVWLRVRSSFQPRRKTGLALAVLLAPMVLTGYALQVAVEDPWRDIWIVSHVASSVLWLATYAIHQFSPRTLASTPGAVITQSED